MYSASVWIGTTRQQYHGLTLGAAIALMRQGKGINRVWRDDEPYGGMMGKRSRTNDACEIYHYQHGAFNVLWRLSVAQETIKA